MWMRYWNYVINIKLAWMWLKIKDDIAYENGQISGYIALDDLCWAYDANIYLICQLNDEQYMFSGIHVRYCLIIDI